MEHPRPTRSLWLAPTYDFVFGDGFGTRSGLGLSGTYELHFSPLFNLGLTLAYRIFPEAPLLQQVGYGAILKHFFSPRWTTEDGFFPFLQYGLLLQQSFLDGRSGIAVSHDTLLGVGAVVRISGVPLFAGVGGHFSRLDAFDRASQWIPYFDVQLGWVPTF